MTTSTPAMTLCLLLATVSGSVTAQVAPSWYVHAQGSAVADAADGHQGFSLVTDGHQFDSGLLQRLSYTATTGAAARGVVTVNGSNVRYAESGNAEVTGSEGMGALRGIVDVDTAMPYQSQNTSASASISESWTDQLTFHTGNPLGVDYAFSITLDDFLTTALLTDSNSQYTTFNGNSALALAQTGLDIKFTNGAYAVPQGTFLIDDRLTAYPSSDPSIAPTLTHSPPPARTLRGSIHVLDGDVLNFSQYLVLQSVVLFDSGDAGAEAQHTAYFDLSTTDSSASYTAASGTVYATAGDPFAVSSVPEPSGLLLMLGGLSAVGFMARRKR